MFKIAEKKIDHLQHLSMENDYLQVEFLPEIGAKMTKLTHKKTGRQFLLQPQNRDKNYHRPFYGADFERYDTSGFDECFPTVSAASYRHPASNTELSFPDHGELWSIPWDYNLKNGQVVFSCGGNRFPYHFEKHIKIDNNVISIVYRLQNLSENEFYYLWSAHPLLQVEPGDKLYFGDNLNKVFLNWSSEDKIGKYGDTLDWPYFKVNGNRYDYSVVQDVRHGIAVKCFTDVLTHGMAAVYFHKSHESLVYYFEPDETPYVGLWLCYGGWPENRPEKHLTIAIEPTSGRPDSISQAIERNEYTSISGESIKEWSLKMKIISGKPNGRERILVHSNREGDL
jgi:galactose mutarotase-like enzyme